MNIPRYIYASVYFTNVMNWIARLKACVDEARYYAAQRKIGHSFKIKTPIIFRDMPLPKQHESYSSRSAWLLLNTSTWLEHQGLKEYGWASPHPNDQDPYKSIDQLVNQYLFFGDERRFHDLLGKWMCNVSLRTRHGSDHGWDRPVAWSQQAQASAVWLCLILTDPALPPFTFTNYMSEGTCGQCSPLLQYHIFI
jgi:hypothetical protein